LFLGVLVFSLRTPGAYAQDEIDDSLVHGTINVALGNENGIVLLTDSMLTGATGQLRESGQKLFKLDDRTVCSFAGFVSAPAASSQTWISELDTNVAAIIDEYARQSANKPRQSIQEKLGALAFLIRYHLTMIANVRQVLGNPPNDDLYRFQLIMAGTDTDGEQKIARTSLRTKTRNSSSASNIEDISITTVEDELLWRLNGMQDVGAEILQNPIVKPDDPAINLYAKSLHDTRGNSMTIDQMVELAKRLAYYTSKVHREVGGPNQIAILKKSQDVVMTQPTFVTPRPSLAGDLDVSVNSVFSNIDAARRFTDQVPSTAPIPHVFVRCSWILSRLTIDATYFVGSVIEDSQLFYDGGPISLGNTNRVINTSLILGPHAKADSPDVKALTKAFRWVHISYPIP
jgi:20S proteasome alpha/beta subunit